MASEMRASMSDFGVEASDGHGGPWVRRRTWQRLRKVSMVNDRALEAARRVTEPWASQTLNLPKNSIWEKKKKKKRLPISILSCNKDF